jgi:hypothetical protein
MSVIKREAADKLTSEDCKKRLEAVEKCRALTCDCYTKDVKELKGIHGVHIGADEFEDESEYLRVKKKFEAILRAFFDENADILNYEYKGWARAYNCNLARLFQSFISFLLLVKNDIKDRLVELEVESNQ